jgi:hypothetical protein
MDLRNWTKMQIYDEFQNPAGYGDYKFFLYLFEEFDISIKDLHEREKASVDRENDHYKRMKAYRKYKYCDGYDYSSPQPASTTKTDEKKDDKKDEKKDTGITTYARTEFTLRDLLELFQGPVPFEGMLILATTNKYDEIKTICPELFRPGRMTPVHFGYINKDTLQDIAKYYFNKKLTGYLPNTITLPTSQIIDLALEACQHERGQFEFFSREINKLLDGMQ